MIFTGLRVFCVAPLRLDLKCLCVAQKLGGGAGRGLGDFHRFALLLCCTFASALLLCLWS